jgi:hypothetical protein
MLTVHPYKQMSSNLLSFWRSCGSNIKYATLLAAGLAGLSQPVSGQLTIQIVNDSGLSDTNIYIMVPGAAGATLNPQSLFVDKNAGVNAAVALSTLATNSWGTFTLVSPISGNTDTVYSFQASYISVSSAEIMG